MWFYCKRLHSIFQKEKTNCFYWDENVVVLRKICMS